MWLQLHICFQAVPTMVFPHACGISTCTQGKARPACLIELMVITDGRATVPISSDWNLLFLSGTLANFVPQPHATVVLDRRAESLRVLWAKKNFWLLFTVPKHNCKVGEGGCKFGTFEQLVRQWQLQHDQTLSCDTKRQGLLNKVMTLLRASVMSDLTTRSVSAGSCRKPMPFLQQQEYRVHTSAGPGHHQSSRGEWLLYWRQTGSLVTMLINFHCKMHLHVFMFYIGVPLLF